MRRWLRRLFRRRFPRDRYPARKGGAMTMGQLLNWHDFSRPEDPIKLRNPRGMP